MASEQEKRLHRCCFTGHRPEKLEQADDEIREWLTAQIENAIDDGYLTFITGMAMGVDIWAGEIVVRLREQDPRLHLIAAVPWQGFSARWNPEWKKQYEQLLKRADLVRYISHSYNQEVFARRNQWMIAHSSRVIGFYNGSDGSTKDMIESAKEAGLEVVIGGEQPPRENRKKVNESKERRDFPLNLIDAIMNCATFQSSSPVLQENIPEDFDRKLRIAASTIKDERAYDYLIVRYKEKCTLQIIAERENLSRERIRQLLAKYIKRLRNPDILRYFDCGIENIPDRTSAAMVKRLQECEEMNRS